MGNRQEEQPLFTLEKLEKLDNDMFNAQENFCIEGWVKAFYEIKPVQKPGKSYDGQPAIPYTQYNQNIIIEDGQGRTIKALISPRDDSYSVTKQGIFIRLFNCKTNLYPPDNPKRSLAWCEPAFPLPPNGEQVTGGAHQVASGAQKQGKVAPLSISMDIKARLLNTVIMHRLQQGMVVLDSDIKEIANIFEQGCQILSGEGLGGSQNLTPDQSNNDTSAGEDFSSSDSADDIPF